MLEAAVSKAVSKVPADSIVRRLFAEFGVRMAAMLVDVFIVMFLAMELRDSVLAAVELNIADQRPVMLVIMFLYLTAFWVSPMRSTPGQFLFGMRVVDEGGKTLKLGPAAVRAIALVALTTASAALFYTPFSYFTLMALPAYPLLFLAAVTSNRQAGHDLLARSLVVNRISLNSAEHHRRLLEHVADKDPATRSRRGPGIISVLGNLLVFGLPVFIMLNAVNIMKTRDMLYRTGYAIREVSDLQFAVELSYTRHRYLPRPNQELGSHTTVRYPDGGYYTLQEDGEIWIRFETKPELMNGSLVMSPILENDLITWQCRVEGDINERYVPPACRGSGISGIKGALQADSDDRRRAGGQLP